MGEGIYTNGITWEKLNQYEEPNYVLYWDSVIRSCLTSSLTLKISGR